jgi:aconitate hydratase
MAVSGRKRTTAQRVREATPADGTSREFRAVVRIDTPQEALYYRHGGILQYVLRQLLAEK